MNKIIFFVLDYFELYPAIYNKTPKRTLCYSYFDTEEAINNNIPHIVTYDIGHLSFDLEDLGYTIFIGYKGHSKQFYTGMSTANGKELRFGHNLRRLLIGGALDNDLGIDKNRNKFWYDKSKSTHELLEQEKEKQESLIPLALKVAEKTIGFDLEKMNFEDIGKNLKNFIEKATKGKYTTNGANGITEQLIAKNKEVKDSVIGSVDKRLQDWGF